MDKKIKEIARILDENIHKEKIIIKSKSLSRTEIKHLVEFIESIHKREKAWY